MGKNSDFRIVLFHNYIESYITKYNAGNQEKITDYQSASVCIKQGAYSILEFQPKGDLVVSGSEGIFFDSPGYTSKVHAFINHSFRKEYDLVLSPEYSIPISEVRFLLKNNEQINAGTLYCLCCQGVPKRDFSAMLKELEKENKYEICYDCYNYLYSGEIVCVLLYIIRVKFFINHNCILKTFVIPQPKTNPMKDPKMSFERSVLATGKTIISFGRQEETKVLGIICSDVFNFTLMNEIKEYVTENRVLLIHPQLNSKPENDYFRFMRAMLFSYSKMNSIKIITVNWANETTLSIGKNAKESPIENSWSAVYDKYNNSELNEYYDLFDKNARRGVNIAHNHQVISVFFPSEEFMIDYQISTLSSSNNPEDIQKTIPLKVLNYYSFFEGDFKEKDYRCELMIDDLFVREDAFSLLNDCRLCKEKENYNCKINQLNQFMASLCQRSVSKEFEIINDGKTTSVTSKHYRSEYSKEKLYICKKILAQMKKKNVTNKFKNADSFRFLYIEENDLVFNIKISVEEYDDSLVRIVFLKNAQKNEAESVYNTMREKYKNKAENIMVFYETEDGIFVYPRTLSADITSGTVCNNSSIVGGAQ